MTISQRQAKMRMFQIVATATVNIHVARTYWGLSKGANRCTPIWKQRARIAAGPATPSAVLYDQHRTNRAKTMRPLGPRRHSSTAQMPKAIAPAAAISQAVRQG